MRTALMVLGVACLWACSKKEPPPTPVAAAPAQAPAAPAPKPVDPSTPEGQFWTWFAGNQSRLADVPAAHGPEPIAAELKAALDKYQAGLDYDLGPVRASQGDPRDLILTAKGAPERFAAVERLASAAPPLPRWKVTALYPRRGADRLVQVGNGHRLTAHELFFRATPAQGGRVDLEVRVPDLASDQRAALTDAALLFLTDILGERDLALRVGKVTYVPLEKGQKAEGLEPLTRLAAALDPPASP